MKYLSNARLSLTPSLSRYNGARSNNQSVQWAGLQDWAYTLRCAVGIGWCW